MTPREEAPVVVVAIRGAVVGISFEPGELSPINDALAIHSAGRGATVRHAGGPVEVPVGDTRRPLPSDVPRRPIHNAPPPFRAQDGAAELFRSGIKVIDLLTPRAQGGKAAMFGGALFWFAETAREIWDDIDRWHERARSAHRTPHERNT